MRINPRRFWEFLLLLMMFVCLTYLYLRNMDGQRANQLYQEAGRLVSSEDTAEPFPAPLVVSPDVESDPVIEDAEDAPAGMNLSPLREVNADVVGWIEIPGVLSYPLLQGEDNAYYLSHAWNGEENAAGAIFLDCRADADLNGL